MKSVPACLLIAALVVFSLVNDGQVRADDLPFFQPQGIETFDGQTWSGLSIGKTTPDDIKKHFRNSRKSIYQDAMELLQPAGGEIRVDALFSHGKRPQLQEIAIESTGKGFTLSAAETALGGAGEDWYDIGSSENHHLVLYREKGILLLVVGDALSEILLGTPDEVAQLCNGLSANLPATPPDGTPVAHLPATVEIGRVDVEFNLRDVPLNQDQEADRYRRRFQKLIDEGLISLRPGAPGVFTFVVSGGKLEKDSYSIDVTGKIDAIGPTGPVTATFKERMHLSDLLSPRKLLSQATAGTGQEDLTLSEPTQGVVYQVEGVLTNVERELPKAVAASTPEHRQALWWEGQVQKYRSD